MHNTFNSFLRSAGLDLTNVRLLRHSDKNALSGRTPYELWRNDIKGFDYYQSLQNINIRDRINVPYWASFVVTLNKETMFVGLYSVTYRGLLSKDIPAPHNDDIIKAGSLDEYNINLCNSLSDYIGKLFIEWGPGKKAWVQRADRQNKSVLRLLN